RSGAQNRGCGRNPIMFVSSVRKRASCLRKRQSCISERATGYFGAVRHEHQLLVGANRAELASEGEPARYGDRREAVAGRPVAELAGSIVAPAIRGPARRDGAGMVIARAECREREPARDRDRSEVVGEREPVKAPAVGSPTSRYAARETAARAYGGEREPARDRDWGGAAGVVRADLRSSVRAIAGL